LIVEFVIGSRKQHIADKLLKLTPNKSFRLSVDAFLTSQQLLFASFMVPS
jgi:hypothetical protein